MQKGMKRVLVFRTSVETTHHVRRVKPLLDVLLDKHERWNFDLEDCDRILRVESASLDATIVAEKLAKAGFMCEELKD